MSERPIQPDRMADALVPSQAATPEVSGTVSTPPTFAPVEAAVPSLPPASQDADTIPPGALVIPKKGRQRPPYWKMPKNSVIRKKALAIVAMRANGLQDAAIAKELGLGVNTIKVYIHQAVKAGWLVNKKTGFMLTDPADQIEFGLAQKAVDNLKEMLESDKVLSRGEKSVKMEATLALANGVLFKKFDQPKETQMNTNVLQINIQGMPTENVDASAGGTPLYIDGETLGEDQ